jgi:hypothetical protein
LTKKEREALAATLFKLRGTVLQDLGIPGWHLNFPFDPNGGLGPQ